MSAASFHSANIKDHQWDAFEKYIGENYGEDSAIFKAFTEKQKRFMQDFVLS